MRRSPKHLALLLPLAASLAACAGDSPTAAAGGAARALAPAAPAPICLDYNVPPLGSQWGGPPIGTPVNSVVFVENGIVTRVHTFTDGVNTFFGLARVEPSPVVGFGAGPTGLARSISWGFDFTGLPFAPSAVTFDWFDPSGAASRENLRVNASPLFIGNIHTPPAALGGVAVATSVAPLGGGLTGTVKLTGPVQRVVVGGQPIWIDHVCAYP